jgi:hypothetical protein
MAAGDLADGRRRRALGTRRAWGTRRARDTTPDRRGFPSGSVRLVRNPGTVPMMADGSLLRSGGETWGPVSPDNVQETGVWPGGQSEFPIVVAEAKQVERTGRNTCLRAESEFLCPSGDPRRAHGPRRYRQLWDPVRRSLGRPSRLRGWLRPAPAIRGVRRLLLAHGRKVPPRVSLRSDSGEPPPASQSIPRLPAV